MFLTNHQICKKEFQYLKQSSNCNSIWKKKLFDPPFGNPIRSLCRIQTSCNTIHHAYHIERYLNYIGNEYPDDIKYIFEFGGGYGNFCRIFNNIDSQINYTIFGLPYFSSLQNYYLSNTIPEAKFNCLSDIKTLTDILIEYPKENTLFIATWSLCEVPIELRTKILHLIKKCKYFLIAYQGMFSGIDNNVYFSDFKKEFP